VRISDEKCTTTTLPIQSFVTENQKSIADKDGLSSKLDTELLNDFFKTPESSSKKPAAEATVTSHPSQPAPRGDPLMVSEPRRPMPYGASDLDPLGRMGGGGMLFDPPGAPRGGGFPMPNFDPFHPHMPHPGLPRFGGPGLRRFGDDLPPPGHHDMFG
jgi:hypothetical protein